MQPRPQSTELFSSPARAVLNKHRMASEGGKEGAKGCRREALAGECLAVSKAFPLSSLKKRETGWQMGSVCGFRLPIDVGPMELVTLGKSLPLL